MESTSLQIKQNEQEQATACSKAIGINSRSICHLKTQNDWAFEAWRLFIVYFRTRLNDELSLPVFYLWDSDKAINAESDSHLAGNPMTSPSLLLWKDYRGEPRILSEWIEDCLSKLEDAYKRNSELSMIEIARPNAGGKNWVILGGQPRWWLYAALFERLLLNPPDWISELPREHKDRASGIENALRGSVDNDYYDHFRQLTWKCAQRPQKLHLLPICKLVGMEANDNYQAWIEYLYPFAPNEDYPFPIGQTKQEQANKISEFRDRILRWSNDPSFKNPEVKIWAQEAWARLKYAAEHSSSLSFLEIIRTYPEDYVEFGKIETSQESNMRQANRFAMNDIARRALLYRLVQEPPNNIITREKEIEEIKRQLAAIKVEESIAASAEQSSLNNAASFDENSRPPENLWQSLLPFKELCSRSQIYWLMAFKEIAWMTQEHFYDIDSTVWGDESVKEKAILEDVQHNQKGIMQHEQYLTGDWETLYSTEIHHLRRLVEDAYRNRHLISVKGLTLKQILAVDGGCYLPFYEALYMSVLLHPLSFFCNLAEGVQNGAENAFMPVSQEHVQVPKVETQECPFDIATLSTVDQRERFHFVWQNRPTLSEIKNRFQIDRKAWHKWKEDTNSRLTDCKIMLNQRDCRYEVVKDQD